MLIFNVLGNFARSIRSSIILYLGIIWVIYSLINILDPATYSAKLRKERADKKYNEIAYSKSPNRYTESDYFNMGQAIDDGMNADESPFGKYMMMLMFGGAVTFIGYRKLSKYY